MSEIKYEDIYYMLKDVAFDQEYPTEAYKKIAKEITKVETERDRYKAEVEYEHRRRVAAEEIALEIEMISDFELSDFNNIKSCRTNLMQIHEAAMKLKSIIKEAGEWDYLKKRTIY
jgi:(p)ppGpp synthase/HD superfamily hydrolase